MPIVWPPPPPRIAAGTVSAGAETLVTVPLPAGLFTAAPVVVATVVGSRVPVTVQNVTATEFRTIHNGSASLPIAWIAYQP